MFTKNDGRELVNPLADIFYIKEKGDMGVMYSKSGMFGFWMKGVTGKSFKLSSVSIEELVNHAADASTRDVMNAFVAGVKEARINHSNAWGFALNTYNMPEQELVTLMELDLARIVQFDFEKAKRLDPFIEHFSEVPLEELDVDVDVSALSGFSPRAYKLDRLGANRDATAIAVECPVTGDIKTAAVIYKRSDKSVLGAAGYDNGLKYNIAYQDFIQDNGLKFVAWDGLSWPGGVEPEMAVDLEKTNFFDHDQGYAILKRPKKQVYCVMRKGPSGSFVDGTVMATFSKRGDGVSVRDMYPHDVDLAVDSLTFVKEEMGVRLDLHKDACKFRYTGKNIPDLLNDAGYAAIGGDIVKMPFSKLAKYNQDDVKINVTSVDGTVFFNVRSKRLSFERGALHIETEQLLSPADIKAVRAIEEEVGVKVPVADRDYFGVTGGSASPDEVIKVGDVSLKRCVGDVQGKGNRFTGAYEIFDGPEADGEPIGRVDVFGAISLDKSFPTALISSLEAVRLGIENGLYEEAITLKSENVA